MITSFCWRLVNVVQLLIVVSLVASCATLEKARLRFDADSKGELTFTVWAEKSSLKGGRVAPELLAAIQNCGFNARQNFLADTVVVDAIFEFSSVTALGTNLDCLPTDWLNREVTQTKDVGLIYTTYRITIRLEQKVAMLECDIVLHNVLGNPKVCTKGLYLLPQPFFPLLLTVEVPGKIVSVDNYSEVQGSKYKTSYEDNRVEITNTYDDSEEDLNDKYEPLRELLNDGKDVDIPVYRYGFVITSREARFEIGTIATIVGALFGSGVLVQILVWLRSRRSQVSTTRRPKS